jgi:serine/threonine protein kinase
MSSTAANTFRESGFAARASVITGQPALGERNAPSATDAARASKEASVPPSGARLAQRSVRNWVPASFFDQSPGGMFDSSFVLDPDPLAGTRYRALEVLGQGAMGEVFLAENVALENRVVVKLIKAKLATDAAALDRMRLEAQAAARVSHPNVIGVLDFSTTSAGLPFLVMEYLRGHTLQREVSQRGALPIAEAVDLTLQLLSGLSAVHDLGVVHRDIKPANIFLCGTTPRVLKILDFGIAKVTATTANSPAPLALPTAEGVSVGTPRFLAPEQALGYRIGPTADIYAVGVLLFWMLTGRDPFHDRKETLDLMKAHLLEPPPLASSVNPAVPPELDRVIDKALSKKPEDRYQTATEFLEALSAAPNTAPRWNSTEKIDSRIFRPANALAPVSPLPNETAPMPTLLVRGPAAATTASRRLADDELTTTPFPRIRRQQEAPARAGVARGVWLLVAALIILSALGTLAWLGRS